MQLTRHKIKYQIWLDIETEKLEDQKISLKIQILLLIF